MKPFILVHRAQNNAPLILNTSLIICILKDEYENSNGKIVGEKTLIRLNDENVDGIFVNESVERIYNLIYDIPGECNNKKKNN